MSENYPAENRSDASQPNSGAASWYSGWEEFSEAAEIDAASVSEGEFPAIAEPDWHPVDPPQALRVRDLEQTSIAATPLTQSPEPQANLPIDLPNWSVRTIPPQTPVAAVPTPARATEEPTEQTPDVHELISLIQELNQCNSALLDRVTQLEDALEQSQKSGLGATTATPTSIISADQVTQLFQELENAHQTTQRQQVLIETLSGQLNSNQEHIAQLESNYAMLQQRLQEQAQQIAQSELTNRDLQVRLQRQQRYTLQFKAALERCLEVSTPPFDLPDMSAANASISEPISGGMPAPPLSPKVRQIQPWSSGENATLPSKLDILRGQPLLLSHQPTAQEPQAIAPTLAFTPPVDGAPVPPIQLPADATPQAVDSELQASSSALQAAAAELKSVLSNLLGDSATESAAEADVWQDLARLVEVSPEDVARASQAEEVEQFVPPPLLQDTAPKSHISMPSEVFQKKKSAVGSQPIPPAIPPQDPNGTSPAPIVYPFRPLKKIDSLASVDLPSFPRPGTVG